MEVGYKISFPVKISKEVYEGFISVFNDRNPLHTDAEFAKAKGFKGKVMHGNILTGVLSYFVGEKLPVKDVIIHRQEIAFNLPVYLDDELTFEAVVDEYFESVNATVFKFSFTNTEGKKVAKGKIQTGRI